MRLRLRDVKHDDSDLQAHSAARGVAQVTSVLSIPSGEKEFLRYTCREPGRLFSDKRVENTHVRIPRGYDFSAYRAGRRAPGATERRQ